MGKFSTFSSRTTWHATIVKKLATFALAGTFAGIVITSLIDFNSEKATTKHREPLSKPSRGFSRTHAESHAQGNALQADRLHPVPPRDQGLNARNDSNDGSCETLLRHYPSQKPGTVELTKRKRWAVVTYSDGLGSKTEHYCKVRANHCAYAELDGEADCIDNRNLDMCIDAIALQSFHLIHPAAWAKVSLLQHCCRHYEYVLLLDADLIVMDASKYPLRRFVNDAEAEDKDLTFTGTGVKETPMNSGLVGVRCGTSLRGGTDSKSGVGEEFLRKTLEKSRSMSWRMNGLWEQRTMRKLYLENAKYRDGTMLVLPERKTQCSPKRGECSAEDFSVHFLGDKLKYETEFLRYFCASRTLSDASEEIRARVC